jgi:hypothetical protein
MSRDESDQFDELNELEDDEAWYSDDPEEKHQVSLNSKLLKFSPIALLIGVAVFFLPTTVGGNITLSSGRTIEYGQGSNLAVACSGSSNVAVTPSSYFVNSANGSGTHYLKSIEVANIPTDCDGDDFVVEVYDNSSSSPLNIFNTSSKQAIVWYKDGVFRIGSATAGASIQSAAGAFTLSFDTPTATSASSVKIALQTKTHDSCFSNSNLQCGLTAIQAPFSAASQVVNNYAGDTIFVLDSSGAIYKSSNSGKNWSVSLSVIAGRSIVDISSSSSGRYVVAANGADYGGIYRSSDYGSTWQEIFPSSIANDKKFFNAKVSDDGQSIIATLTGSQSGKIFYSSDFGSTWNFATVRMYASGGGSTRNFAAINGDGSVMATMMQNGRFNRSVDGGTTWDTQTVAAANYTVSMSADGNYMATVQLNTAIVSTSNGKDPSPTWTSKTGSDNPGYVFPCRADPSRLAYLSNNNLSPYVSVFNGQSWVKQTVIGAGTSAWFSASFTGDCSRLYLVRFDNKLYVSNG